MVRTAPKVQLRYEKKETDLNSSLRNSLNSRALEDTIRSLGVHGLGVRGLVIRRLIADLCQRGTKRAQVIGDSVSKTP